MGDLTGRIYRKTRKYLLHSYCSTIWNICCIFSRIVKPNLNVFFVFSTIIILLFTSGCVTENNEIEIDLNKTHEGVVQFPQDNEDVIYFGFDLRLSPKEDARIYSPFLQYLSEETGHTFKIHFTHEYGNTVDDLGEGVTQFAALGALSYINAHERYGATCLVRGLNADGRDEYRAAIVTCPDSNISEIEDIRGKTFCFGSFYSTQGHLIPRKMLKDNNITLSDLEDFTYAGSHLNCAKSVIAGECCAGAMQDTLAFSLENEGLIRIIAFSDYYPSSGISANKDVDPALVEAVKKALLDIDPKGEHAYMLTDWDKTEMPNGFVEAHDEDYAQLRELAFNYGMVLQGAAD